MSPASYTLEEQETVVRYDRTNAPAMLYTASPNQAERWRKLGYDVKPMGAHGWQCTVPKNAVKFRKLVNGETVKARGNAENLAKARAARGHSAPQG